jgi:PLP dependent protein
MTTIAANLLAVQRRIADAAERCGRNAQNVTLLAVSKTFDASAIQTAYAAGQQAFGESYVQEALPKIDALAGCAIEWHFVGPIQSNKTRPIAERFDWVHAVDRQKIAARLAEARPAERAALNVCIQVNVSGEASKSGVAPGDELALAEAIAKLPRLRLRGLMAVPEPTSDPCARREAFALLRQRFDAVAAAGHPVDTLSMGMSDDMDEAIAEGATLVRIGTAIFGQRERA